MTETTTAPGARVADPDDAAVSQAVRVELARLGIQQKDLADRANRAAGWLNDRMRGKTSWRVSDVSVVATALGVPRSRLLPDPPLPLPED